MPDQPSEHAEARPSSNLRTRLRALMDLTNTQPSDILPAWAIMVCLWPSFQWDLQAGNIPRCHRPASASLTCLGITDMLRHRPSVSPTCLGITDMPRHHRHATATSLGVTDLPRHHRHATASSLGVTDLPRHHRPASASLTCLSITDMPRQHPSVSPTCLGISDLPRHPRHAMALNFGQPSSLAMSTLSPRRRPTSSRPSCLDYPG